MHGWSRHTPIYRSILYLAPGQCERDDRSRPKQAESKARRAESKHVARVTASVTVTRARSGTAAVPSAGLTQLAMCNFVVVARGDVSPASTGAHVAYACMVAERRFCFLAVQAHCFAECLNYLVHRRQNTHCTSMSYQRRVLYAMPHNQVQR